MARSSYVGDPYWLETRRAGPCAGCKAPVPAGSTAFYWPKGRRLECEACGELSSARFECEVADEDLLSGWRG